MAGLISIGLTGLLSHQSALSTTGNNVANANTPGYSRQQAIFETLPSHYTGSGFVGTGVTVSDIQRLSSEFVNQQLRSDETLNGGQSVMAAELGQLDNLFGAESTGLNTVLSGFFSALQDSAESPDSIPQRQLLISRGEALAQRFQSMSARLSGQAGALESQLEAETAKINSLAKSIAELNQAISSATGQAQGLQPNELLDQRDEKLRQLAQSVRIQVTPQDNGQVDVYMGNGQSLVSRDYASTLTLEDNPENPGQSNVMLNTGGAARRIGSEASGGRLGSMLEFRESALVPAQNALGRIALGVASTVNEQHRMGLDLDGNQGGLFFSDVNSDSARANRVTANSDNTGTGVLSVAISDLGALGVEDYVVEFSSATDYVVSRASDSGVAVSGTLPGPIAMPGFNIEVESGIFAAGDRFRLSPAGPGARDIEMAVSRPRAIALASPLKAETGNDNIGSGAITQGTVLDIDGPGFTAGKVNADFEIVFTSTTEFDVVEDGVIVLTGQPYTPGQSNPVFSDDPAVGAPAYQGFQFEISGRPGTGDRFQIGSNDNNSQDNRNAVVLGDIARLGILDGGNSSLDAAYGLLVSDVGTETSRAQRGLEASATLLEQSSNNWQQQSGVNLDEEAGKLIQFQAAYNASAQVITVARELFDTLLSSFR